MTFLYANTEKKNLYVELDCSECGQVRSCFYKLVAFPEPCYNPLICCSAFFYLTTCFHFSSKARSPFPQAGHGFLLHKHLFLRCERTGCRMDEDSKIRLLLRFLTGKGKSGPCGKLTIIQLRFGTDFFLRQISRDLFSTEQNINTLKRAAWGNSEKFEQENRSYSLLPRLSIEIIVMFGFFSGSPTVSQLFSFSSIQMETTDSLPPWNFFCF